MTETSQEFRNHRERLVQVFKENGIETGLIIYNSAPLRQEPFTGSDYHFYQEGLFYWMTGWEMPDSVITIDIATGHSTLYIQEYGDRYEIWNGPIPKTESIVKVTGVDEVKFVHALQHDTAGVDLYGADKQYEMHDNTALLSAAGIVRRVKTPYEVAAIKKAAELTSEAIIHVMKNIQPGWTEQRVDAEFTYIGAKNGAREKSFLTIAASGQDAVYLHNSANEGVCNDGELLLLDCGFFWDHYAGDITRTFPVNGKFSEIQRTVYSALLKKQIELCEMVKPGLTFTDMNRNMHERMYQVLVEINLVKNPEQAKEFTLDIARFFTPHGLTHHVGCNVHDVNYEKSDKIKDTYELSRTCATGNIVTIEPGLYFHKTRILNEIKNPQLKGHEFVDWDFAIELADKVGGIRIEDDLLVTENGYERLSPCPKSVEEIEQIMKH